MLRPENVYKHYVLNGAAPQSNPYDLHACMLTIAPTNYNIRL
jgi:hypothetical protein